jgi:ACS family hexuronate transporter-like MFS transporter
MSRPWRIATLLFFATLLNYFDRQILALVSPVLRVQFSLSAVQYAHLLNSFLLGYTLLQLVAGLVVDRIGARTSMILAMLWWSTAGAAAAFARTPNQLALCLFLMGVGESANWPTAVKAVQQWFPPEKRAVAVGFFNAGSSVGAILAPFIVTRLTLHYSWRAAFIACGILGLLWVGPWRMIYRLAPQSEPDAGSQRERGLSFLRDSRAWGVIGARFFADSIWFFYIFWLPDYLTHVQKLSLAAVGSLAWIPFVAAGLGNFAGGAASGRLVQRGRLPARARLTVMGISAAVMVAGAAIRFCHHPGLALALISTVVFAYSAWAANVLTLPSDLFPASRVAAVVGMSGTVAGLGGILTTHVAGLVIDRFSYGPVFAGLGCLPVLAFLCSLLAARTRHSAPLESPIARFTMRN